MTKGKKINIANRNGKVGWIQKDSQTEELSLIREAAVPLHDNGEKKEI